MFPNPPVICAIDSIHGQVYDFATATGPTTAYPAANRAYYTPIWIDEPFHVTFMFHANGSFSGNYDIGIYDKDFTRLWSVGGVALSGGSTNQSQAVTGLILGPGLYYLAFSCNNTTATFLTGRSAFGAPWRRASGCLMQESAYPLPANATPIALDTTDYGIVLGISNRSFF